MSTLPKPVSRPDGDYDGGRHVVLLLDRRKLWRELSHLAASRRGKRVESGRVEIAGRRLELGLPARLHQIGESLGQRRAAWHRRVRIDEMRQGPIELEPLDVRIEHGTADAHSLSIGPKRLEPRGKALIHRALVNCDLVLPRPRAERRKEKCAEDEGKKDQRAPWREHKQTSSKLGFDV
jgi:hypothetical protein